MLAAANDPIDLSLVIACYNEGPTLAHSIDETFAVLGALRHSCEIIFIDDASRDETTSVIESVISRHPGAAIRFIRHAANVGRGGTVTEGMRAARGRWVGFLDIDLEVHATYLVRCLVALEQGYDVATARRIYKFRIGSVDRYVISKGYSFLVRKFLQLPVTDTETGFKFFSRERILPVLEHCKDRGWFWDTEVMALAHHARLRIHESDALFVRRADKHSTVRPVRDSIVYFKKLWRFRPRLHELRSTAFAGTRSGDVLDTVVASAPSGEQRP